MKGKSLFPNFKEYKFLKMKELSKLFLAVLFTGLLFSCNKDEELPAVDPTSNAAVNRWVLDIMDEAYYWLGNLGNPISEDASPEDYFEALLYRPTDRFSVIYPDYQELINSLNGISLDAGYEFILYRESSTSDKVFAEVSYIKKNSPASSVDLKRGDRITAINNREFTVNNFREILGLTEATHNITYSRYNSAANQYDAKPEVSLTPVQLSENPNFLDTIYTINNQKIGYMIYHFFSPGPGSGSKQFDNETDAIFAKFKAAGVNNLIVDFRYNGGGFVSSAVNLASLIAPGVRNTDVFSKTKYNSFIMEQIPELRDVKTTFLAKNENLGNTLSGNRIYILTSNRTASASELIVNGLKPYMDVFLIGNTTTGKNVGSIPFEDEANPENKYGILPIVTQSFNSLDQSDYTTGFKPNVEALESAELLLPLGDINEQLLRKALAQITGTAPSGRIFKSNRLDIASSLDQKNRSGRMIESSIRK
jgi:carboxyl-terminal processing protease